MWELRNASRSSTLFASAEWWYFAHEGTYVRLGLYDQIIVRLVFGIVMDVNCDAKSSYVQQQTDHEIVAGNITSISDS